MVVPNIGRSFYNRLGSFVDAVSLSFVDDNEIEMDSIDETIEESTSANRAHVAVCGRGGSASISHWGAPTIRL
jgi:fructoselysine-6-P-deglycase FrlB-like protein